MVMGTLFPVVAPEVKVSDEGLAESENPGGMAVTTVVMGALVEGT